MAIHCVETVIVLSHFYFVCFPHLLQPTAQIHNIFFNHHSIKSTNQCVTTVLLREGELLWFRTSLVGLRNKQTQVYSVQHTSHDSKQAPAPPASDVKKVFWFHSKRKPEVKIEGGENIVMIEHNLTLFWTTCFYSVSQADKAEWWRDLFRRPVFLTLFTQTTLLLDILWGQYGSVYACYLEQCLSTNMEYGHSLWYIQSPTPISKTNTQYKQLWLLDGVQWQCWQVEICVDVCL